MPSTNPATIYQASRGGNVSRAGLTGGASGPVADSYSVAEFWSREQADLFEKWRSSFSKYEDSYNSPYFDYFYSGQDISVRIEGLGAGDSLPIYSFGYVIEQQKQPVYGFWDYTYSAMLRGTRIVSGAFTLVSTQPNYLTRMIAKASSVRARANSDRVVTNNLYALRGLDDDEANINHYWYRNYDNNLDTNQQHLFSIHPPFNFLIKYGIQETSLTSNNPAVRLEEYRSRFGDNDALATDVNERLVKNPSVEEDLEILLENVELMSKSTQYDSDGNPVLETYAFVARDERLLSDSVYQNPAPLVAPSSQKGNIPRPV